MRSSLRRRVRTDVFVLMGLATAGALAPDGQWVAALAVLVIVFGAVGVGALIMRRGTPD